MDWSPGRLNAGCQTVAELIRWAYSGYPDGKPWPLDPVTGFDGPPVSTRVLNQEISSGPAWVNTDRYTVEMKADGPASREMMRGPLMQALLEDRCKLKIRREAREVQDYELTVAKGGSKLQPTKEGSCTVPDFSNGAPQPPGPGQPPPCGFYRILRTGGMDTSSQTMAGLCLQFSAWLDRDVMDKTGLTGRFDVHLDLSPSDVMAGFGPDGTPQPRDGSTPLSAPADPLGAIVSAVQKLGLKLEAGKGTGQFLVIDHIERPSEN